MLVSLKTRGAGKRGRGEKRRKKEIVLLLLISIVINYHQPWLYYFLGKINYIYSFSRLRNNETRVRKRERVEENERVRESERESERVGMTERDLTKQRSLTLIKVDRWVRA